MVVLALKIKFNSWFRRTYHSINTIFVLLCKSFQGFWKIFFWKMKASQSLEDMPQKSVRIFKIAVFYFPGATIPLWLCWRPQIWALFDKGVDVTKTLLRFLWVFEYGGCSKSGSTSGHCARMPSQKFWCHSWMFCFSAQLLFPPVLFCLSWHWFLFWIERVSWNQREYWKQFIKFCLAYAIFCLTI